MVDLVVVLQDIAKAIVNDPDAVKVTVLEDTASDFVLELNVAPDDIGKVIGKHGRIAKAIRMVMKAASISVGKRVIVKIR